MASVEQLPARPLELPATLRAAIVGDDGSFAERITQVLTGAGCALTDGFEDGVDVLIGAHERASALVCSEIRERRRHCPDSIVILVVERASSGDVRRALQAGAHAVVSEALIESALLPSIGAALAGQIVMPAGARRGGQPGILTTREKQILGLVVMGMTNAEIASKLFLAESTVKSHLSSAFAKLGVSSRSEASSVILDPHSGAGLGILTIPTE